MPILLLFIVLSSSSLFAYSNIAQYNSVKADSLPSNPADVLETESSIILGEQNQGESVTLPMGKRLIICLCQDRITLGTCNGPNYAWSPAASSSNSKILAIRGLSYAEVPPVPESVLSLDPSIYSPVEFTRIGRCWSYAALAPGQTTLTYTLVSGSSLSNAAKKFPNKKISFTINIVK